MTHKAKLANYDKLKSEHDKLMLAVYDLTCATKFPFTDRVTVNGAKEIDETFTCILRISVSHRKTGRWRDDKSQMRFRVARNIRP